MKRLISLATRFVPRPLLQRMAGGGLKIASLVYAGSAVTCPICGHSFRKFLPYGRLRPRANALCPGCLSLERHRLIWLFLQNESTFFSDKVTILHIAPEACFIKKFEKIHGNRYITADLESPLAKIRMDIHSIPFSESSFNFVLCNHVLEHVADDKKAMSEIYRVLKPGGTAILQVPFFSPVPEVTFEDPSISDPRSRELAYGQDDHVRKYGRDFASRIASVGFEPIESRFAGTLSPADCQRYGLVREEVLYGGRKARA